MRRQYLEKQIKNAVINLRTDYAQHIKLLDDMLTEIVDTCMSRSDSKTGIMVTSITEKCWATKECCINNF